MKFSEVHKYKLQEERNTNYGNSKYLLQKYELHKYIYTNYRNTNYGSTEIQLP